MEDALPVLRMVRRELYAQARSRGLTQVEAYDEAGYGTEAQSPDRLRQRAVEIEANAEVRARIDELMERDHDTRLEREEKRKDLMAYDDAMGKVEILQGLRTVFDLAIREATIITKDGDVVAGDPVNLGAANRALELMGKQEGMFIDRKHITRDDTTGMDTAALKAAIEKVDAQLAGLGEKAKDITVIEHDASPRHNDDASALGALADT